MVTSTRAALLGRRWFVQTIPQVAELLDSAELAALTADQKMAYDEARPTHHARLLTIGTPAIRRATVEGRRLSYLNRTCRPDAAN
jgi:hypothetical protein